MSNLVIKFADDDGPRQCGGCTLCCKLIPVKELDKPAGERCKHQKHSGCAVYRKAGFPMSCHYWSCRWRTGDDTRDLRRPDRSRYVVDIMPDYITAQPNDGSAPTNVQVVQIWCDPNHRDAWRDPELLAYIDRRGAEGIAALIRWGSSDGMAVFPPSMTNGAGWVEHRSMTRQREHSMTEKVEAISGARRVTFDVGETE